MTITRNKNVFCDKCRGSIEYCFCSCPYCGEITKSCHCNGDSSKGREKIVTTKHYSKLGLLKQSKRPSFVSTKDDDWWRLEKWQIGRSRFP